MLRSSKFSTDPTMHHPVRLAIVIHLVRGGGRDRFQRVCELMEPASSQVTWQHCKRLERDGYIHREVLYVGRGHARTWLQLMPAGYAALDAYRNSILNMVTGPIVEPPRQLPTDAMEVNAPS